MIRLQFSCAALGVPGYSQASRGYLSALATQRADIDFSIKSVNFEPINTDQSKFYNSLKNHFDKKNSATIKYSSYGSKFMGPLYC
jgi:hypothetical protein